MGLCAEFHLLKYVDGHVVYHRDSGCLVSVSAQDAALVRDEERDAAGAGGLRARLRDEIERAGGAGPGAVDNRSPGPLKVVLLVSHACNLGCVYCFQGERNDEGRYMTPETARRAVDVFLSHRPERPKTFFFFGGEPLLNWDTVVSTVGFAVERSRELGVEPPQFAVQTNGTLLDPEKARFLKEHDFLVTLSLDGPPAVNDSQRVFRRGGGSYDGVLRGISCLADRSVEFNLEATITSMHVRAGVSVGEVFSHLVGLGASCAHIMPVVGPDPGLRLPNDAVAGVVDEFAAVAAASVDNLVAGRPGRLQYVLYVIENLLFGPKTHICYAGTGTVTVTPEGGIYPCYYLTSGDLLMGDVAAWHESPGRYRGVQARMWGLTKEHVDRCRGCWAKRLCSACYGAEPAAVRGLSAPAVEVCRIQRGIIDAVLSRLVEIGRDPGRWSRLMENLAGEFAAGA